MKNLILVTAAAAMFLSVPGTLFAGTIDNLSGQSCGDLEGEWHFVANQIPRNTGQCTIVATWDSGDTCEDFPDQVNNRTQHFNCIASGELLTAVTNLNGGDCPGRLVLSDFSCEKEPPCEKDCPK